MQIASARLQDAPATCVNITNRRNRYVRHATRACAMRFEPVAANKAAWATAWKILHFRGRRAPKAPLARPRCTVQRCWQPRTRQTGGACSLHTYGGRPADARPDLRHRAAAAIPTPPHPPTRQTHQIIGESRYINSGRPRALPLVLGRLSDREVHGAEPVDRDHLLH